MSQMPELDDLLNAIRGVGRQHINLEGIKTTLGGHEKTVGDFKIVAGEKHGHACVRVFHPLLIKHVTVLPDDAESLTILLRELTIHTFAIKALSRLDIPLLQMQTASNFTAIRLLDRDRAFHIHLQAKPLTLDGDVTIHDIGEPKIYPAGELCGGVGVGVEHIIILGDGTTDRVSLAKNGIPSRGCLIRSSEIDSDPSNEFMLDITEALRMGFAASTAKTALLINATRTPLGLGVNQEEGMRAMAGALLETHPLYLSAERLDEHFWGYRTDKGKGIMLDERDQFWRKDWSKPQAL